MEANPAAAKMGNAAAIDAGATEKVQLEIYNFWFHYSDNRFKGNIQIIKIGQGYVPGYCSSLHCSDWKADCADVVSGFSWKG